MIRRILSAIVLAALSGAVLAAYDPQPRDDYTLQGSWQVNAQAGDDVERIVAELLEKEEKERRRFRRQMAEHDRFEPPDEPMPPDPGYRRQQERALREQLGVTKMLKIMQTGGDLEIESDSDRRRFRAGSSSQVSMRNGDLADAEVGWDGEWFVIDRRVPGRVRQVEKLRLVKKTGQLEYVTKWSGDDELAGVKLRRIFDRVTSEPPPEDPARGPVR